jgi:SAM-dependent methyltransferase
MWVPQLPASLYWDHNEHYHRWLLQQLPEQPGRVLDVGCGAGLLASRIAGRAGQVDGVDRSAAMIEQARSRYTGDARRHWITGDLLDPGLSLAPGGYDAVTALSSLHHLPLRAGLARLSRLVRPGGMLAVVGLYRPATPADYAFEPVSIAANWATGAALRLRRNEELGRAGRTRPAGVPTAGGTPRDDAAADDDDGLPNHEHMPVLDAQDTLPEIRAAARELTPGAQIRRRVFWRYSLAWHRPESP